jgi:peptidoglycan/xylan/chitin deacetylase (PgdA/CDA1 family)
MRYCVQKRPSVTPGPIRTLGDPQKIALTFDDGPSEYTEPLLEVLRAHGDAKATFFLLGHNVELQGAIVRKIHAAGHSIGNHSYSHKKDLCCLDATEVMQELVKCDDAVRLALGGTVMSISAFRAPYGNTGGHILSVANSLGLKTFNWSAVAYDWLGDSDSRPKCAESIVNELSTCIDLSQQGEIVLLHDGYPLHEISLGPSRTDRSEVVKATGRLLDKYLGKRQFVHLGSDIQMVEWNS